MSERSEAVIIFIDHMTPPSLNVYTRMHYHAKTRLRELWREVFSIALSQNERNRLIAWAEEKVPVQVDFVVCRQRFLDEDNLWGSVKVCLDALKVSPKGLGWIADDSAALCTLSVKQVKNVKSSTEVTIQPKGK